MKKKQEFTVKTHEYRKCKFRITHLYERFISAVDLNETLGNRLSCPISYSFHKEYLKTSKDVQWAG